VDASRVISELRRNDRGSTLIDAASRILEIGLVGSFLRLIEGVAMALAYLEWGIWPL
jgi:hypothetical protein